MGSDDATARQILDYLREQRESMVAYLERLTRAESPTESPASQGGVQRLLAEALEEVGFRVRRIPGHGSGGHILARPATRGCPAQLLLGHTDTVWPLGTLEEMPVCVEENRMTGPGVYDMKGGLAQMVYALRALHALELAPPLTPVVFVNSDEETGSRDSVRFIRLLARRVRRAFVLEPGLGPSGKLKIARKGAGRFLVHVRGVAAHAGVEPGMGRSAILELSYLIQRLFDLNDRARGVTVNVGVIDGGLRANMVAPESRAMVDVRVPTREDAARIESAILSLEPVTPGVELEVEGRVGRPPMERTPGNRALWRQARRLGRQIGLELEEEGVGGASDGNTTSQFTATLDGLGAVGGGAHAEHEWIDLDRMVERSALLALLLLSPDTTSGETPVEEDS